MSRLLQAALALVAGASVLGYAPAAAQQTAVTKVYTTSADFLEGTLSSVNLSVPDQLQLDVVSGLPDFAFVCVALTGRGTLVRIDAVSGQVLAEYRTAPAGLLTDPSRTAVDSQGDVWVGNSAEDGLVSGVAKGSVCKIGIVVGGTRVDANGNPDPSGGYLKPPFAYNTCVDRDGDGLIRTSMGLGNVLPWPNLTDGVGGADGVIQDAVDEAILVYQRVAPVQVRQVSLDANDDVWVGGYAVVLPIQPFEKVRGTDGAILSGFQPACGGNGGLIDGAGVLWSTSPFERSVLRRDLATQIETCIPMPSSAGASLPTGLTLDANGFAWIGHAVAGPNGTGVVTKLAPNGTVVPGFPVRSGGGSLDRTLCVTPADNHVWVGNSGLPDVSRLDNNGAVLAVVQLGADGADPRGVSVDANGKVWVACFGADTAKRIDPNLGSGAVDLTVQLGTGAFPDDYGTMTGSVPQATLQPNGAWSAISDSGARGTEYGRISWTASVPASTGFEVEFRAADTVAALASLAFQPAQNGTPFASVFGRFLEVRARFLRSNPSVTASPVLFDLTIEKLVGAEPPVGCPPPGSRNPASLLVYPEFDNRFGDLTLLSVTNTKPEGASVEVEFVYIGRYGPGGQVLDCLEFNRTETLTANDTLSLITKVHNPTQAQGFVYAFAKDPLSGAAIVYNHLVGQAVLINGIDAVQYSHDAFGFCGVGDEGTPTDDDGDGRRDLDGFEYGQAPDEVYVPRFLGQTIDLVSELVLVNLTGGAAFDATLDLLIYNDNEEAFSAQRTFRCWEKERLVVISNAFENGFLQSTAHAPGEQVGAHEYGWFKIDGNVAYSSAVSLPDPAFLAVLVERVGPHAACDLPFEVGEQPNGDLYPLAVLGDTSP